MLWQKSFQRALADQDLRKAVDILDRKATTHAATPPAAVKKTAIAMINEVVKEDELINWATELSVMPEPIARELACSLLESTAQSDPQEVLNIFLRVADDPNWEVREFAAGTLASLLASDFSRMYPACKKLSKSTSSNVRRSLVVAVKYVAKERNARWAHRLFGLLAPLLTDRTPYIRKNLGPFALGDGMLRYYPELTWQYIKNWTQSTNEVVLWNVAMCLSTAEARKNLKSVQPILYKLGQDERSFVWHAVVAALKKHSRAHPREISLIMKEWSKNPKLRKISELVTAD